VSSAEQLCCPKMFLTWNTGCYSAAISQTVVLPAQNGLVSLGSLGGLTPPPRKTGHSLVQVFNFLARFKSLLNSRVSASASPEGCLRQLFALVRGCTGADAAWHGRESSFREMLVPSAWTKSA